DVTVSSQAGLAQLMLALSGGLLIAAPGGTAGATLVVESSDGKSVTQTYDLDLGNVFVTGVAQSSDGEYIVSLSYTAVDLRPASPPLAPQQPTESFTWDLLKNASGKALADAAPLKTVSAPTPTDYYMLIPGLDGGEQADPAHKGWFHLSDFSLDLDRSGGV